MPDLSSIILTDAKSTPVQHTFSPVTSNGQKAQLANRSASIPKGYERLNIEVRPPASANAASSVFVDMTLPTVALKDGLDQVVDSSNVSIRLNFSQNSPAQLRKDVCAMLSDLFGKDNFVDAVENLEPFY